MNDELAAYQHAVESAKDQIAQVTRERNRALARISELESQLGHAYEALARREVERQALFPPAAESPVEQTALRAIGLAKNARRGEESE